MALFPNRPDHADFWRLSSVVTLSDLEAEHGKGLKARVADFVDIDSLTYMGEQRLGKFAETSGMPKKIRDEIMPLLLSVFMDAFCLGVGFEKEGGKQ